MLPRLNEDMVAGAPWRYSLRAAGKAELYWLPGDIPVVQGERGGSG